MQRECGETKRFMCRTMAQHVWFKTLQISKMFLQITIAIDYLAYSQSGNLMLTVREESCSYLKLNAAPTCNEEEGTTTIPFVQCLRPSANLQHNCHFIFQIDMLFNVTIETALKLSYISASRCQIIL